MNMYKHRKQMHTRVGDVMYYFITLLFYLLFLWFSILMGYTTFQLLDLFVFLCYLVIHHLILQKVQSKPHFINMIGSFILIVLSFYRHYEIGFYYYELLMYYICLESFTFTFLYRKISETKNG